MDTLHCKNRGAHCPSHKTVTLDLSEWDAALAPVIDPRPRGSITASDYAAGKGITRYKARDLLEKAVASGTASNHRVGGRIYFTLNKPQRKET